MLVQFHTFDSLYLERLRCGDARTEEHFVDYFSRLIRLKLSKRLHSQSAIEDVRQETFTRVWIALRKEKGIRQPERLGAFVNSVCDNVLREHYRATFKEASSEGEASASLPDTSISAINVVARKQLQWEVGRILADVSAKHRDLIRKVFFEERDKNEICRDFGVDRKYLRVLLHRARRQFRELYLKKMGASRQRRPTTDMTAFGYCTPAGCDRQRLGYIDARFAGTPSPGKASLKDKDHATQLTAA